VKNRIASGGVDGKLARATLLALRMTLLDPDEGGDEGYCLLPHRAPLDLHGITAALVALDKPVTCVGIGIGGLLGVGCWPLPDEMLRTRQEAARYVAEMNEEAVRQLADSSGSVNALLLAYNETLLLPWSEYVEWQRQYFLFTLQSHLRPASPQYRALGAQAELQICGIRKGGSSGGGTTKSSPDPTGR
jgi:hypothetical protein